MSYGNRKQKQQVEQPKRDERPRFLLVGATQAQLPDTLSDPRYFGYDARAMNFIEGHFFVLLQLREKTK